MPSRTPKSTFVVVLSWNGKRWLGACLSSLKKHRIVRACDILVVDNGSTDGSAQWIRENHPDVALIETGRNLGFAEGNNAGIDHALRQNADYILLLNQDTVVFEGWMEALMSIAETQSEFGILSPFQYDYAGTQFDRVFESQLRANTSYFNDLSQGEADAVYPIPQVVGAAMLIRAEILRNLGGFDPFYFLYFEEKDLCRRVLAAGYEIGVVPASKIGHYHGQLHAEELKVTDVDGYFLRNRQVFILKDPTRPFWKNLYIYLRYGLPNSLKRKYDSPVNPPTFLKALRTQSDILWNLPRIFLRRRWECARIQAHLRNRTT